MDQECKIDTLWFLSSAESSSSTTKDFINYKYWL